MWFLNQLLQNYPQEGLDLMNLTAKKLQMRFTKFILLKLYDDIIKIE